MIDWTAAMQQTFEYYMVDPVTWKDTKQINTVITSSISRDLEAETLGSASIVTTEIIGECYIRIYLITIQNGIKERHPLGTYMVQTPSYSFDGKVKNVTIDAYTPLIELKETQPPLGYSIEKNENILDAAYDILTKNMRAPIIRSSKDTTLSVDFVANLDDTWASFIIDLLANTDINLELDELGRVMFSPEQALDSMQPVWTFDASNSSILYNDFDVENDLYGIPNVVEVIYSNGEESVWVKAINDDPNSPVSTINRGRKISHRITDPKVAGNISEQDIQEYANKMLRKLSAVEFTVAFKHGYCPARVGDCIRINYEDAGLSNVKARIIKQSITCEPGCPVTTKAVFATELWR